MELHRFFRYAIEKMCKEKKSLNHFKEKVCSSKQIEEIKKQNDFSSSDYKMITAHQKRNLFEKILLCIGIGAKTNIGYGQLKKL